MMKLKPLSWSICLTVLCLAPCAKSWASQARPMPISRTAEDRRLIPEDRRLWHKALRARYALIWGSGPLWCKDTGLRDGFLTASGNETCVLVRDRRRISALWHSLLSTSRHVKTPVAAFGNSIFVAFTNVLPKDGDMEIGSIFVADIGFRWLGGKAYRQDNDDDGGVRVYELRSGNGARFESLIRSAVIRARRHSHGASFFVCDVKTMTPL